MRHLISCEETVAITVIIMITLILFNTEKRTTFSAEKTDTEKNWKSKGPDLASQ